MMNSQGIAKRPAGLLAGGLLRIQSTFEYSNGQDRTVLAIAFPLTRRASARCRRE